MSLGEHYIPTLKQLSHTPSKLEEHSLAHSNYRKKIIIKVKETEFKYITSKANSDQASKKPLHPYHLWTHQPSKAQKRVKIISKCIQHANLLAPV